MKPQKTIAYAYATSTVADILKRKDGCWFVEQLHPAQLHGPFDSLIDAEAFCNSDLSAIEYGYWSRRADPANEMYSKA